MTTILVVVADVCPHEPDEMALAEDYDMLEELATTISDPALGGTVLPRAPIGASAIKCGSGRQSHLNVGVSCSRTGAAKRSHDFLY